MATRKVLPLMFRYYMRPPSRYIWNYRKKGQEKYNWRYMLIGESIVVPGDKATRKDCKAYNAAKKYEKTNPPWKCIARQTIPGYVRIWRIE